MFKKNIRYILYMILAISIYLNLYLICTFLVDKPVVAIEGDTILSESELFDYYTNNYKTIVVNQYVNDYLLRTEAKTNNISEPTLEELEQITIDFPAFAGYSTNIEKNRAVLEEAYYVYKLFMLKEIDDNTLKSFLEERYGNKDTKLYEIYVFETNEHVIASEVENRLKKGESISNIEEQLDIQFFTSYTTSLDNIINGDSMTSTESNEHDMSNMDTVDNVTTHHESISNPYLPGEVFHIMNDSGMEIIQIGNVMSLDSEREHFINLYFAQKYTFIKSSIINDLKSKCVVSYY